VQKFTLCYIINHLHVSVAFASSSGCSTRMLIKYKEIAKWHK